MSLAAFGLAALAVWRCWVLARRPRPPLHPQVLAQGGSVGAPAGFPGAVPPERYVVMRWPVGAKLYGGCLGAQARQVFEHEHPGAGETIELWELSTRRGHKEV